MLINRVELLEGSKEWFFIPFSLEEVTRMMVSKKYAKEIIEECDRLVSKYCGETKIKYVKKKLRLKDGDYVFSFSLNDGISLYNNEEDIAIVHSTYDADLLEENLTLFRQGQMVCSGSECNNIFKVGKGAGKLLAGEYCDRCWESKYEEMAKFHRVFFEARTKI